MTVRQFPSIAGVMTSVWTVPTDFPEADGTADWDGTTLVLAQVIAGSEVGLGWTYGSPACAAVIEQTLAPVLVDHDPMATTAAWTAMVRALRNLGRPGIGGMALSAVDYALWDLKARLLEIPLHRLLGAVRGDVAVYGSGGFITYDDARLREQVRSWQDEGMTRVKIKIGENWGTAEERDLRRVEQVREWIGPDVELFVDANGAYSAAQAIRLARAMERYDVRWFEEPVSSEDTDGLRAVRERSRAEVAAGEYGHSLADLARLCTTQAVGCLQIDVTRCGGITEFLRAAAVAAAHGLDVSGHCAPNLHAPLLAALPNARHVEWFHDHRRIEAMLFEGALEPRGGTVRLREDQPGLGIHPRPEPSEDKHRNDSGNPIGRATK
ncbi:MAG TPA: enolase C-terminal domain-like protein [Sporichthyaceae bacterium]|nr:enolase C-terminal domain-like protein [Sporichthyaceae bacterium]